MSNYGLKVGTPGVDVTQGNAQQTRYSSEWSNFKVHSVLTLSFTVTAGSGTIANPLSYMPIFLAYNSAGGSTTKYRLATQTDIFINWEEDADLALVEVYYRPGTNDFKANINSAAAGATVYTIKIVVFVDKVTGTSATIASGGDFGLRISRDTFSATTGDDTSMSMTSEFQSLSVLTSGTADVTYSGGYTPVVAHGLSYIPIFICFFSNTSEATASNFYPVSTTFDYHDPTLRIGYADAWIDGTNLNFQTAHTSPAKKFKYIIFNERLV